MIFKKVNNDRVNYTSLSLFEEGPLAFTEYNSEILYTPQETFGVVL